MKKKEKTLSRMKNMLSEFKSFALRGRAFDLAIGVIIGGAFSGITNSLVNDIIMPFAGMFMGGVDFSNLNFSLPVLFQGREPIFLNLGTFINTVINFIILALIVFFIMKAINRLSRKEEEKAAAPPAPGKEELLLTEIRDLLKARYENENINNG